MKGVNYEYLRLNCKNGLLFGSELSKWIWFQLFIWLVDIKFKDFGFKDISFNKIICIYILYYSNIYYIL